MRLTLNKQQDQNKHNEEINELRDGRTANISEEAPTGITGNRYCDQNHRCYRKDEHPYRHGAPG